jgi:hypothetical protein
MKDLSICPIGEYFKGDEDKCDPSKCDYDDSGMCSGSCEKKEETVVQKIKYEEGFWIWLIDHFSVDDLLEDEINIFHLCWLNGYNTALHSILKKFKGDNYAKD